MLPACFPHASRMLPTCFPHASLWCSRQAASRLSTPMTRQRCYRHRISMASGSRSSLCRAHSLATCVPSDPLHSALRRSSSRPPLDSSLLLPVLPSTLHPPLSPPLSVPCYPMLLPPSSRWVTCSRAGQTDSSRRHLTVCFHRPKALVASLFPSSLSRKRLVAILGTPFGPPRTLHATAVITRARAAPRAWHPYHPTVPSVVFSSGVSSGGCVPRVQRMPHITWCVPMIGFAHGRADSL